MKLNLRSVDLNLLPIFESIFEHGQLSKAALSLGMSQPALSAALQRLRLSLKDPLFTRSRKGLHPTPRAIELYQQLHPMLENMRLSLSAPKAFDPVESEQRFNIVSGDFFEMIVLPHLLADLQSLGSAISIAVQPFAEGSAQKLINSEVQMIIDAFPIQDARINSVVCRHEKLVVIASNKHPDFKPGEISQKEFFQAQHIVLPERKRKLQLDILLENEVAVQRKVSAQVGQYTSLLAATAASNSIATIPETLALQYAERFGLQILPIPFEMKPVPIYLMTAKATENDLAQKWLIAWLLKIAQFE